nr:NAD-dependent epimerase/dehydratase family protein [Salinibacter ruber]
MFQGEVDTDTTVVVCGAGGFIGGHLVADLLRQGYDQVRAVDIKPPNQWFQKFPQADNRSLDLREKDNCYRALEGADQVYNLAADMGGMGFIEHNKALCMLSVRINTHLLMAARDMGPLLLFVERLRLQRREAGHARRGAPLGRGRLPGPRRGRLRVGEALQRADVSPFPRGF